MTLSFGDYEIDVERRELRRAKTPVHVEPQVFDLLVYLVQNRDRVVSKDDLIASVWGGRIVSDSTLTSRINAARNAVGDSGEDQKLIRTIARKGLRFVGAVRTQPTDAEPADATGPPPDEVHERSRPALPLPDRPAIAVLPFINMSGDPEQEYFSDGISEDIITALSKLRWFFVIARNSSFIYKGKAVHMKQVAEELGVGYVVEGSVRKGGDRVRITAQLNDVATGSHIWAERYDRGLADVFAVQDEITEAIVAAIEPQLYAAENFRAQAQAAGQPGRVGSGDAGAVALLASDAAGQSRRAGAAGKGDQPSIRTTVRRSGSLPPAIRSAPIWVGRRWQPPCRSPSALRWRRSAPTARIPGRTTRLAASICLRGVSTIRWPSLSWRCDSIRTSRWPRAITACRCPIAGAGRKPIEAARRALRLSPRDPFSAIYCGIAAYAQFLGRNYDEAMRLAARGIRQRGDFVGAHRVLTAAAGMAGQNSCRQGRIAGTSPCAAQHFARLDRKPNADQAGRRPRALSGGVSPCRTGMTIAPPSSSFSTFKDACLMATG